MAAILLNTGLVYDIPNVTRDQVLNALAGAGGVATGQVNGVTTTIRATAVMAVSDSIVGLRPKFLSPEPDATMRQGGNPDPTQPQ